MDAVTSPELLVVVKTLEVHDLIVCILCSCYPRNVLGRPPDWCKSFEYRARTVRGPRAVALVRFEPPEGTRVAVYDSTTDVRYMGLPMRVPQIRRASKRRTGGPSHAGRPDRGRHPQNTGRRPGVEGPAKAARTADRRREGQNADQTDSRGVVFVAPCPQRKGRTVAPSRPSSAWPQAASFPPRATRLRSHYWRRRHPAYRDRCRYPKGARRRPNRQRAEPWLRRPRVFGVRSGVADGAPTRTRHLL